MVITAITEAAACRITAARRAARTACISDGTCTAAYPTEIPPTATTSGRFGAPFFCSNVRFWHEAAHPGRPLFGRFRGKSGPMPDCLETTRLTRKRRVWPPIDNERGKRIAARKERPNRAPGGTDRAKGRHGPTHANDSGSSPRCRRLPATEHPGPKAIKWRDSN